MRSNSPSVGEPWLTREVAFYVALVLFALLLRLIALGDKPLHHDESLHATYAWYLFQGRGYQYDAMMHGPLQFHIVALIFYLFGVSTFTARLLPALFGAAIVAVPFFLRRELGRSGTLFLAVGLTLSPSFLYFSRFLRNDIYIAFFTLSMIAVFFRFLERPRGRLIILAGALCSLSFCAKENTYITMFVFGTFVLAVLGRELLLRPTVAADGTVQPPFRPFVDGARAVGAEPFVYATVVFAVIFTLFFTTFFSHPTGLVDGLTKSVDYWLSQQPVARGSEPWYYYVVIVPAYEPLSILFGLAGCVLALRYRTYWAAFLLWYAAGSLLLYSWAGEKMPWLVLHVLLPFMLLAAWMLDWIWQRRASVWAQLALALAGLLAVYMVHSAFLLAYVNPANPVEMLVYVQTTPDVLTVTREIKTIATRSGQGYAMPITIDGKDSWPFVWYLRNFHAVSYPGSVTEPQTAPVVIVADEDNAQIAPFMTNYVGQEYQLRAWWVEQPLNQSDPMKWLRWALWREPWNPLGSYNFHLYLRRDLANGP